jgi:hypothetical protein
MRAGRNLSNEEIFTDFDGAEKFLKKPAPLFKTNGRSPKKIQMAKTVAQNRYRYS